MRACPRCGYREGVDGARLRALRKERGLRLRGVAAGVGVSMAYLSDIENGNRPASGLAARLARFFDVDPSRLARSEAP